MVNTEHSRYECRLEKPSAVFIQWKVYPYASPDDACVLSVCMRGINASGEVVNLPSFSTNHILYVLYVSSHNIVYCSNNCSEAVQWMYDRLRLRRNEKKKRNKCRTINSFTWKSNNISVIPLLLLGFRSSEPPDFNRLHFFHRPNLICACDSYSIGSRSEY